MLSTLHTNDAVSTVVRLTNMGVPNFMVASALSLIVAQRLARKNCSSCIQDDDKATKETLLQYGFTQKKNFQLLNLKKVKDVLSVTILDIKVDKVFMRF